MAGEGVLSGSWCSDQTLQRSRACVECAGQAVRRVCSYIQFSSSRAMLAPRSTDLGKSLVALCPNALSRVLDVDVASTVLPRVNPRVSPGLCAHNKHRLQSPCRGVSILEVALVAPRPHFRMDLDDTSKPSQESSRTRTIALFHVGAASNWFLPYAQLCVEVDGPTTILRLGCKFCDCISEGF